MSKGEPLSTLSHCWSLTKADDVVSERRHRLDASMHRSHGMNAHTELVQNCIVTIRESCAAKPQYLSIRHYRPRCIGMGHTRALQETMAHVYRTLSTKNRFFHPGRQPPAAQCTCSVVIASRESIESGCTSTRARGHIGT